MNTLKSLNFILATIHFGLDLVSSTIWSELNFTSLKRGCSTASKVTTVY